MKILFTTFLFSFGCLWQLVVTAQNVANYAILPFVGEKSEVCTDYFFRYFVQNSPNALFYTPNDAVESIEEYHEQDGLRVKLLIEGAIQNVSSGKKIVVRFYDTVEKNTVLSSSINVSSGEFSDEELLENKINELAKNATGDEAITTWINAYYTQLNTPQPTTRDLLNSGNMAQFTVQHVEDLARQIYLGTDDFELFKMMEFLQVQVRNFNRNKQKILENDLPKLRDSVYIEPDIQRLMIQRLDELAKATEDVTTKINELEVFYNDLPRRKRKPDALVQLVEESEKNSAIFVNNYLVTKDNVYEMLISNGVQRINRLHDLILNTTTTEQIEAYKKERYEIYTRLLNYYQQRLQIYNGLENVYKILRHYSGQYNMKYRELSSKKIQTAINQIIGEIRANL